jgi:Kef-type K+ transport system membrane component KefB
VAIASIAAVAVAFTLFVVWGGRSVLRLETRYGRRPLARLPYFPLAIVACLGLAVAAEKIGIAAIVGAFLAGLVFSEEEFTPPLKEKIHSLNEFLVPFFFVAMGMQMDVTVLARKDIVLLAAGVTLLAILGKLVGCGLGAYRLGWRPALQVGTGMVPRGEVGIIVASIGLGLHTISDEIYAVVILMVLATTLAAPPALKLLFVDRKPASSPPSALL